MKANEKKVKKITDFFAAKSTDAPVKKELPKSNILTFPNVTPIHSLVKEDYEYFIKSKRVLLIFRRVLIT